MFKFIGLNPLVYMPSVYKTQASIEFLSNNLFVNNIAEDISVLFSEKLILLKVDVLLIILFSSPKVIAFALNFLDNPSK